MNTRFSSVELSSLRPSLTSCSVNSRTALIELRKSEIPVNYEFVTLSSYYSYEWLCLASKDVRGVKGKVKKQYGEAVVVFG